MASAGLYLLLLLGVGVGWILGRLSASKFASKPPGTKNIHEDYFIGLNYLLNDEPDEAIDTFINALEINSDTVETHLALGALLRRRGKVDKAIKIHQTLLGRSGLNKAFSDSTRLQLGLDYISAGLLDRAERLLSEILDKKSPAKWDALRHLITIYQTEKEWDKAIECSSLLLKNAYYKRDSEVRVAAAHYCCELAQLCISKEENKQAREQIRKAFAFDRKNVRASLLLARIEQKSGNFKAAIKELIRVRNNNPEFVSQVLSPLAECYEQIHNMPEYEQLLKNILPEESDPSVVLALSHLIKTRVGDKMAIEFLNDNLSRKPSLIGLVELLRLQIPRSDASISDNLNLLQKIIDSVMQKKSGYQCNHCGYESMSLYWLCPSCQKWDKIKPTLEARAS